MLDGISKNPCALVRTVGFNCDDFKRCADCERAVRKALQDALEREYEPKERDSLEKIEADATIPAATYCVRNGLVDSDTDADDATICEMHIRDLLRRQRELLGGEQCE